MAVGRKEVLVRMPADLKRRLAEEVAQRKSNVNDVAVGILSSRFAVPFEPSGRSAPPPGESGDVILRMPPELSDKLKRRAGEARRNTDGLSVEKFALQLGVETPRTRR